MSTSTYSAVLQGLDPTIIEVEVAHTPGLPILQIIGLATNAVVEAKERITTALANQNISIATKRTVVNLAPTDLKKSSPALDLAIIIALLKQNNQLTCDTSKILFLGEIALNGRLKPVAGMLPIILKAKKLGFEKVIIPHQNAQQVTLLNTIECISIASLGQVITYLKSGIKPKAPQEITHTTNKLHIKTFNTIIGQSVAKRALQIAAAGDHHVLFIGPPGSGKTKLAQSIIELLPELTKKEMLETCAIHSISSVNGTIESTRPFRSPHHTISDVGLLGGGKNILPGEASLAHNGVLFLDELTEFNRRALEALRQPLIDKTIIINRVNGKVEYPANFNLVAACNPCPCGYFGSSIKNCICSPSIRQRYLSKLSGPLLDRIDLIVWVEPQQEILDDPVKKTDDILNIKKRIVTAKGKAPSQYQSLNELQKLLSKPAKQLLQIASRNQQISTRAIIKTIQVAQTIHFLDENGNSLLSKAEILEALQYRWKGFN